MFSSVEEQEKATEDLTSKGYKFGGTFASLQSEGKYDGLPELKGAKGQFITLTWTKIENKVAVNYASNGMLQTLKPVIGNEPPVSGIFVSLNDKMKEAYKQPKNLKKSCLVEAKKSSSGKIFATAVELN